MNDLSTITVVLSAVTEVQLIRDRLMTDDQRKRQHETLERSAKIWGTTPENMSRMITRLLICTTLMMQFIWLVMTLQRYLAPAT